MFAYRLTDPIDLFDGLTPLNDWLTRQHPSRTAWALQAVLALTDAAADVGWRGDMRHLPMVGALPTPSRTTPYLWALYAKGSIRIALQAAGLNGFVRWWRRHFAWPPKGAGA